MSAKEKGLEWIGAPPYLSATPILKGRSVSEAVTIRRREELLEAEVDGELVALHVDRGTCYGYNPTATRIWALLAEPRSLAELCDLLMREYEVDLATCERDVAALLRELETDGLVEISGTLPPA
jgi:hypothetical protein